MLCSRLQEIAVSESEKTLTIKDDVYKEGDYVSLNGSKGIVYKGEIKTVAPEFSGDFGTVMSWADEIRSLKVRANADNPRDAKQAVEFGAQGIGLCRTEHMFFEEERIPAIRQMIMAETEEERRAALAKLLPFQKSDFKAIYEVMEDKPVTIRLLIRRFMSSCRIQKRIRENWLNRQGFPMLSYPRLQKSYLSLTRCWDTEAADWLLS